MTTELAKPANLNDVLRQRVQGMMLDLIPEDQWNKLIADEWEALTVGRPWSRKLWDGKIETGRNPPVLLEEVTKLLKEQAMDRIRALVKAKLDCIDTAMRAEGEPGEPEQGWFQGEADQTLSALVEQASACVVKGMGRAMLFDVLPQIRQMLGR